MNTLFSIIYPGVWPNKATEREEGSTEEYWQEPEVIISLDDPSEVASKKKMVSCHHCSVKWDDIKALKAHIRRDHLSKNQKQNVKLYCEDFLAQDSKKEKTLNGASNSGKDGGNNKPRKKCKPLIECPYCPFKCVKQRTLKTHFNRKHANSKLFECKLCKFSSSYSKVVKRHTQIKHPEIGAYNCNKCTYTTNDDSDLTIHKTQKHGTVERCPFCNNITGNCVCLSMNHSQRVTNITVCRISKEVTSNLKEKEEGVKLENRPEKADEKNKVHECKECDYRTSQLGHLKRHIMCNHTFEKPYKCIHCGHCTARSDHLHKHIVNLHPGSGDFTTYQAVSVSVKPNTSSSTSSPANDSKSFKCTYCECICSRPDNLRRHILSHHTGTGAPRNTAGRPNTPLAESQHTGTGTPPRSPSRTLKTLFPTSQCSDRKTYQCDYCAFNTYSIEKIKNHMEERHFHSDTYQCLFCCECSSLKESLDAHGPFLCWQRG